MPKAGTTTAQRNLNDRVELRLRFNEALRRQIADGAKRSLRSMIGQFGTELEAQDAIAKAVRP